MTEPSALESLAELRAEIDRIDGEMHELLIERGGIIDRLIAVKARQGGGSAFRPGREADMMRVIAARHRGRLPLDTVESIWRVIISTFTFVQSPYAVHADMSGGDAAMRDWRGSISVSPCRSSAMTAPGRPSRRSRPPGGRTAAAISACCAPVGAGARRDGGKALPARARQRSSPACLSSSVPTTPPEFRSSSSPILWPRRRRAMSRCFPRNGPAKGRTTRVSRPWAANVWGATRRRAAFRWWPRRRETGTRRGLPPGLRAQAPRVAWLGSHAERFSLG